MAEPFLAEIRMMSFVFAPRGWALCNGQLLPINQNQALFSLLGTQYGGNGQTNFALPDLRARTPMHRGQGHTVGEKAGAETHTLSVAEMPAHTHRPVAAATANSLGPAGAIFAGPGKQAFTGAGTGAMHAAAVGLAGGSEPHENRAPYLTISFCIALQGIFPSRT